MCFVMLTYKKAPVSKFSVQHPQCVKLPVLAHTFTRLLEVSNSCFNKWPLFFRLMETYLKICHCQHIDQLSSPCQ